MEIAEQYHARLRIHIQLAKTHFWNGFSGVFSREGSNFSIFKGSILATLKSALSKIASACGIFEKPPMGKSGFFDFRPGELDVALSAKIEGLSKKGLFWTLKIGLFGPRWCPVGQNRAIFRRPKKVPILALFQGEYTPPRQTVNMLLRFLFKL